MEKQLDSLIKKQHEISGWNFYDERQHVENLFYSRFNFFLVFYGMLITAIATILSSSTEKEASVTVLGLLYFGILTLLLMQYTLCNIYQTLQILLKLIDGLPAYHSSPIVSSLRYRGHTGFIIAFLIPFLCISFIFFILCNCMDNYCCGNAVPFLLFSGITILMSCLYNLYTATRHISEQELKNVIGQAASRAGGFKF